MSSAPSDIDSTTTLAGGEITPVVAAPRRPAPPSPLGPIGRLARALAGRLLATPPRLSLGTALGIAAYLVVAAMTFGLRLEHVVICGAMLLTCVWSEGTRGVYRGLLPFFLFGVVY